MYKSLVSVLVGETDRARDRKKFSKKKKTTHTQIGTGKSSRVMLWLPLYGIVIYLH